MPFCAKCGKEISADAAFCPECGQPVEEKAPIPAQEVGPSTGVDVWTAVVLSLVFPGLGQRYMGQKKRGNVFIVVGLILVATIAIEIGVVLYPVFLLMNAFDAYRSAKKGR